jgi:predicted RNA binding protein with dsRBD fold (UPF0201 family)
MSQPEPKAKLALEATVSPSEDPEKVLQAMKNIVGEAQCDIATDSHSARLVTEDPRALAHIRDQLRDRHVRSAARRQMLLKSSGRSTSLMLNRQAAAAGVVALCGSPDESPLGPVYLAIESERIEAVIDSLTAYAG